MDHLRAAEIIARMIYNEDRRFVFSDEELLALDWAVRVMRRKAKEQYQGTNNE